VVCDAREHVLSSRIEPYSDRGAAAERCGIRLVIGVVIPVHDEEHHLPACLASIRRAAAHAALHGEEVCIVAVLDACTDNSAEIARAARVETVAIAARSVGAARSIGAAHALHLGADWIAFTDADSRVASDWLVEQRRLDADAVCGTVEVEDWSELGASVRRRYECAYVDRDGHRHVHGANLGVSAHAYRHVGGIPPLREHEDVAFVRKLIERGFRIAWSARPRVLTSARLANRVSGGFGAHLRALALPSAG
jgi:glycosyltransferase involved in cell wall biosynthesis